MHLNTPELPGLYNKKKPSHLITPITNGHSNMCYTPDIQDIRNHVYGSITPSPTLNPEVPRISYRFFKQTYENRVKKSQERILYQPKVIKLSSRSRFKVYQYVDPQQNSRNKSSFDKEKKKSLNYLKKYSQLIKKPQLKPDHDKKRSSFSEQLWQFYLQAQLDRSTTPSLSPS